MPVPTSPQKASRDLPQDQRYNPKTTPLLVAAVPSMKLAGPTHPDPSPSAQDDQERSMPQDDMWGICRSEYRHAPVGAPGRWTNRHLQTISRSFVSSVRYVSFFDATQVLFVERRRSYPPNVILSDVPQAHREGSGRGSAPDSSFPTCSAFPAERLPAPQADLHPREPGTPDGGLPLQSRQGLNCPCIVQTAHRSPSQHP